MTDTNLTATVTGGTVETVVVAQSYTRIENYYYQSTVDRNRGESTSRCPYPGLSYFGPQDAGLFYGRETAVARLKISVTRRSLTALVGASGSGKSSVALAGLAPELHRDGGWRFTHFRIGTEPDQDPYKALARSLVPLFSEKSEVGQLEEVELLGSSLRLGTVGLSHVLAACRSRNAGKKILVIADQFEELFTLVPEESQGTRARFIDLLLGGFYESRTESLPQVCLMLTLRADFYGMALRHRALADALQGNVENLGPMIRSELRDAIVRPARAVTFEPGLVDVLLDDVESRPGSLPLLQFALREMWARQTDGLITRKSYEDIGRIEGALARRAQSIFDELTASGQDATQVKLFRVLFTRLVTLGEGAEDTRRVVNREELGPEAWGLAQQLAGERNRLIVTAAAAPEHETAEVAHEALIRGWPMLIDWIGRDRAFLSWLKALKPRVSEWQANRQDQDSLLRGGPLATADDWLGRRTEELSKDERTYIQESVRVRDERRRKEEENRKLELAKARLVAEQEAQLRSAAEKERDAAAAAERTAEKARRRARVAFYLASTLLFVVGVAAILLVIERRSTLNAKTEAQNAQRTAAEEKDVATFANITMSSISGGLSEQASRLVNQTNRAANSSSKFDRIQTYLDFAKYFELAWKPDAGKRVLANIDNIPGTQPAPGSISPDERHLGRLSVYRHEILGDLEFTNSGQPTRSPDEYKTALRLVAQSDVEPAEVARIYAKLGKVQLYNGDPGAATQSLESAEGILALIKTPDWNKAFTDDVRARYLLKQGDFEGARAHTQDALAILKSEASSKSNDVEETLYMAGELERLGDLDRRAGHGDALKYYIEALGLFNRVVRDDPTSFVALAGLDTTRHSVRMLGKAQEVDDNARKAAESTETMVDRTFREGLGPFKFGMSPHQVNSLLREPFNEAGFNNLPQGGEFRWADVGYFWKPLNEVPELSIITRDDECLMHNGYVSFVFHEAKLFRMDIRLFRNGVNTCPAIANIIDDFAATYGLTTSGNIEERRLRYETARVAFYAQTEPDVLTLDFIQR